MIKKMISLIRFFLDKQFFRYLLTGGILFLFDYGIFYVLKGILNFDIRIAQIISFTITTIFGFFAHKFFVFRSHSKHWFTLGSQGISFLTLGFVNIWVSAGLVWFFESAVGIKSLIVIKVLTQVIIISINYLVYNIIFRNLIKKLLTKKKLPD